MSDTAHLLEIIERFTDVRVALYGDLVLDRFILGTPKRISREAPVIILRYEDQRDVPGGGANALANIAALGARVSIVAAVGDDEPGAALRAALDRLGIATEGIVTISGYRTPTKVRILGGGPSSLKHQVARYDIEENLDPDGAWRTAIARNLAREFDRADAVAVSDYGYGCVIPETLQQITREKVATWTCLDSRHRIGTVEGVAAATPNLDELEVFCGRRLPGDDDVADGAEDLRKRLGARFVLATRGNQGMTLVEAGREARHIPVFGTDQVADVTGAGYTVLAVLAVALASGAEPFDAARLANIAAGLVVMKLGTATVSVVELRDAVATTRGASDGA
ncbi:MAG: PfkB family carbohydrate kinase [Thermoanaerobaculales bacterium]|nr:PfkB family carbohydrate kinase [Thermoanaerobaculales bacterium]